MNIVKIPITSKQELVKSYIQQFKNGGLFIKGNFNYDLGAEVFLIITLPETNENVAVNATVNWLSPETAVGYPVGIGVQFNNDKAGIEARSKIEIMLGGLLQNQQLSYTF